MGENLIARGTFVDKIIEDFFDKSTKLPAKFIAVVLILIVSAPFVSLDVKCFELESMICFLNSLSLFIALSLCIASKTIIIELSQ